VVSIEFSFSSTSLLKKKEAPEDTAKNTTKVNNTLLRTIELPKFQDKVNEFFEELSYEAAVHQTPSELLNNLERHIVKCVNKVASTETKNRPDWFSEAEPVLVDLIGRRNQAFKQCVKQLLEENQTKLKEARHQLLREKRRAKQQWQLAYAKKCKKDDFALNPKEAWSVVFKLMEGFQNHHKTKMPKNFKNKNGVEAKCDKDNANILNSPIYSLFNSGTEADPLALEDFPQYKVIPQLESHQATKSHEQ